MNEGQLRELAQRTPVYAFDIGVLGRRIAHLRQALPGSVQLCYAVKANPFIVRELCPLVDRLEICSPGELAVCRRMDLPAEKFVISGVYKDPGLMRELVREGKTGLYTAESVSQFRLLSEAARACGARIDVLLRLTSGNQFGMNEQEAEEIVCSAKDSAHVRIRGIQYFSGTQKTSLKKMKRELDTVDHFLRHLSEDCGFEAPELEFGPGFPVSYFTDGAFDEDAYLREFSDMLGGMAYKGVVTLELGRSIAASCGTYLTRVVDVKRNRAGSFAIVDGGMHQLVYYGQFMAMKHPHVSLYPAREGAGETEEWNICGSLCTVNDILVKQLPLQDLKTGDVLVFERTGAYCMTEGISLFLTRDIPEILLIREDGSILTVRRHMETVEINCPDYL